MMTLVSILFEKTGPGVDYQKRDYFILATLLVVGVALRFWGLDNVGLHDDEETMALAMRGILENGTPTLPSGMYYSRALGQIYMMAGSVTLFGETAWSLRLPSALIGSIAPLVGFFLGKRFLDPLFNLAFVAVIVFMPIMIELSQTARMYAFWLTALMVFGIAIFRWEERRSYRSFSVAILTFLLALHFHLLSILAAPLFVYPGLINLCWRQFIQGGIGLLIAAGSYLIYRDWIGSKYPDHSLRPPEVEITEATSQTGAFGFPSITIALGLLLVGALIITVILRKKRMRLETAMPTVFLILGFAACLVFYYHIGVLLIVAGLIMLRREGLARPVPVAVMVLLLGVLATVQLVLLYKTGELPGRKLIGAMIGQPSVWPILRFSEYSIPGTLLYGLIVLAALWSIANKFRLPDHFLLATIAVWAPLFTLGFAAWYIPPRYALSALPFFLLCVVAGTAYLISRIDILRRATASSASKLLIASVLVVLVVNPLAFWRAVNTGYERYPDHVGAAEFIRQQNLSADAVLIAEDILQQTYYLGQVGYWLTETSNARSFSVVNGGKILNQYTGAEVIRSGSQLVEFLDANAGRAVYVIGSGEDFKNGVRLFRGDGINEVLESDRLQQVFEGRDNKTVVWKLTD